jgi:GMP synthase (glutamine-hydrolysing)
MKVAFLQHQDTMPPGALREFFIRECQAEVAVVTANETHTRQQELEQADILVSLGSPVPVDRVAVAWVARERLIISKAIAEGRPVLGICFGAQMIASLTGGSVSPIGRAYVGWMKNDDFTGSLWQGPWFRFHKEQCHVASSAEILARSEGTIQAFQYRNAVGVQFHPEMDAGIIGRLVPSMQSDFGMHREETDLLLAETRARHINSAAARRALFEEIVCQRLKL